MTSLKKSLTSPYFGFFVILISAVGALSIIAHRASYITEHPESYAQFLIELVVTIAIAVAVVFLWLWFFIKAYINKRAAKQVSTKNQEYLKEITSTLSDTFYLYNIEEQRYEFISPNCIDVMGADQNFFYSGKSHTETFAVEEDKPLLRASKTMVDKGEPYEIEYRIFNKGRIRWINEKSVPILNEQGKIVRNSGICTDVTEKKEFERALQESYRSTKLLSEIGLIINDELNIVRVVDQVYVQLNKIMDATYFGIGIVDGENLVFPKFIERDHVLENTGYPLSTNALGAICVKSGQDILIHDLDLDFHKYSDKPLSQTPGDRTESVIYLPLKYKGVITGVITVQSFEKNAYSEREIELLRNLSTHIAATLENAKLYENMEQLVEERTKEVQQQNKRLERSYKATKKLSEIGIEISSSLQFEDIFESLYDHVNELLDAAVFGVRLYNKEQNVVEYRYEIENGVRDDSVVVSFDDKDNYTVWCIENKKELLINDNLEEYKKYVKEIKVPHGEMPHSLIFCPMMSDGEVIGAVTVQSFEKNAYEQHHLDILKTLVSYTASAIVNAKLYNNLEKMVRVRTKQLQNKNDEVQASINYAKRIQDSTLTPDKHRLSLLPDSFVFYKPKDIVSGDFFLVDKIESEKSDNLIGMVVADCTGHGVPGASLAILCSSILKQAFVDVNLDSPGLALDYAREKLMTFLKSSDNENIYDGMDVCFGVVDKSSNKFYYSGAFNDCLIIRNGEPIWLRGNRMHVAFDDTFEPFETVEFDLQPGDNIFLSSDGIVDQFGGEDLRKYMRKRYEKILLSVEDQPMTKQQQALETDLYNWMQDADQIDDICVMGIRVDWVSDN